MISSVMWLAITNWEIFNSNKEKEFVYFLITDDSNGIFQPFWCIILLKLSLSFSLSNQLLIIGPSEYYFTSTVIAHFTSFMNLFGIINFPLFQMTQTLPHWKLFHCSIPLSNEFNNFLLSSFILRYWQWIAQSEELLRLEWITSERNRRREQ